MSERGRARRAAIVARGLDKRFTEAASLDVARAARRRTCDVHAGETLAIVGASGSGKSTLLHLLGGLEAPTGGSVALMGRDFAAMSAGRAGRVAQPPPRLRLPVPPPAARVQRARQRRDAAAHPPRRAPEARARRRQRCWRRSASAERVAHRPSQLSGGERQRVAIARALVARPACVLADEPTGNLDRETADGVFELMLELARQHGMAFVLVTHDEGLARALRPHAAAEARRARRAGLTSATRQRAGPDQTFGARVKSA